MKYLRIPWGMRAMKELGLTPALCHPDHTMLFPAEKMPERKKPPESCPKALRGLFAFRHLFGREEHGVIRMA